MALRPGQFHSIYKKKTESNRNVVPKENVRNLIHSKEIKLNSIIVLKPSLVIMLAFANSLGPRIMILADRKSLNLVRHFVELIQQENSKNMIDKCQTVFIYGDVMRKKKLVHLLTSGNYCRMSKGELNGEKGC